MPKVNCFTAAILTGATSCGPKSGKASPCYTFNALAIAHMAAMVSDVWLIALLRNPFARAVPHCFCGRSRGREMLHILVAFEAKEIQAAPVCGSRSYKDLRLLNLSYVNSYRLHAEQLEGLLAHYPRDQTVVLEFPSLDDTGFDVCRRGDQPDQGGPRSE